MSQLPTAAKLLAPLLIAGLVGLVVVLDPLGHLFAATIGAIDLPAISFPDLPGWLGFLAGPGELIVLAMIIVLAGLGERERRRRGGGEDA